MGTGIEAAVTGTADEVTGTGIAVTGIVAVGTGIHYQPWVVRKEPEGSP